MPITRASVLAGFSSNFDTTSLGVSGIGTIKTLDSQVNSSKTITTTTVWTSSSGTIDFSPSEDFIVSSGCTFTVSSGSTYSLRSNPVVEFDLISNDKLGIKIRGTDGTIRVGIVTLSILQ